ncbi:MAG TPA: Rrf2 family transcriptional regulator [Micropepsaceae bacterium]|nr:Rrf2 family transcriptional regulator [Micropepsaceae bacterium]
MKLTRYTDYALRVLIYLGLKPDALGSIGDIAERYDISENHLMKVVQELGRAGYLSTQRGRGGGIKLGRAPDSIRIGDVVRLTEEDFDIAECGGCVIGGACGLTSVFARATAAFLAVLDQYTLADLIQFGDANRALSRLGIGPQKPRRALRAAAAQ